MTRNNNIGVDWNKNRETGKISKNKYAFRIDEDLPAVTMNKRMYKNVNKTYARVQNNIVKPKYLDNNVDSLMTIFGEETVSNLREISEDYMRNQYPSYVSWRKKTMARYMKDI